MMKEKARAMVLASFTGDSLALGAHWIYDAKRIARETKPNYTYWGKQIDLTKKIIQIIRGG